MKPLGRIQATCFALLAVATTVSGQRAPLGTLELRPSRTLPGIPVSAFIQTAEEHREGIKRAIALRPEGPIADELEGIMAAWFMERGEEALAAGDLEKALDLFGEARTRATNLKRTTEYPWIRQNLERWLAEELDSEAALRERHAANSEVRSSQVPQ